MAVSSVKLQSLVFVSVVLCARATAAVAVYQEDYYDGLPQQHHHDDHHQLHHEDHHQLHHDDHHQLHHAGPPPATSYATISTTHVKVQHPVAAAAPAKYATPYKYEYLTQPQTAYKYISLPSAALQSGGKYEEPSKPSYKYLAASPTYKYVQPPAVTTEPEAAEVPTNALKYAFKYEQNAFKQEQQQQQQQQQQQEDEYEQPAVQYKYIAVPSYKYVQQAAAAAAPEYGQLLQLSQVAAHAPAAATPYDYTDDKQQYN